jgi:RIO kinase 1
MTDQSNTTDESKQAPAFADTERVQLIEDGRDLPIPEPPARAGPNQKASYEANTQVQRWLRDQALEDGGSKGPFTPTFLAHQRDRFWVLSSLAHFYEDDLISDVLHVVKSGKEATVYCCAAGPALWTPHAGGQGDGLEYLAAKVYRPRMFRGLKNDAIYRESRALHDDDGRWVRDRRHQRGALKKTDRWRSTQVTSWITDEFETQQLLYEAGADVPRPVAQVGNALLMEYIGDGEEAAPLLREVRLAPEEAVPLFARILRNIELCLRHDRIHGDLSAYNLLYWRGAVTLIDFAQAVDPHYNAEVFALLARDIERVCQHFARYGVAVDASALASEIWTRYLDGSL